MIARPPALRPGDRVAVVSPAGPPNRERVTAGLTMLRDWGFRPVLGAHACDRTGYLAGTDADRVADLQAALDQPEIRAVLTTRGGYGTQRIIDAVRLELLAENPKLFVGYSDLTAAHLAIQRRAGLATLYGPSVGWNPERLPVESADALLAAMVDPGSPIVFRTDPAEPTAALTLGRGTATGRVVGGNLSLLAASLGTPDQPDTHGAILFLEDVAEAPYAVDRMPRQLLRAGLLREVAGVVVGPFTNCAGIGSVIEVWRSTCMRWACRCSAACRLGTGTVSSRCRSA